MNMHASRAPIVCMTFLSALIGLFPIDLHGQDSGKVEDTVHYHLDRLHFNSEDKEALVRLGKKAFPVFLKILSDEKNDELFARRILGVLAIMKEDRSVFLEPAVSRLGSKRWPIRMEAAVLVGQIGSTNEAPPLVALLNDPESGVARRSAQALGRIGGSRERLAMSIWISNAGKETDLELIKDVRDALLAITKRLEKKK